MSSDTSSRLTPFATDLHIHSALSPCAENIMMPDEVIKKIFGLGIDVFSITDHNSSYNCAAFKAAADEHDLLFIPGIELQTAEEIHLLAYFPEIKDVEQFCSIVVRPALMTMKNDPSQFGSQLRIGAAGNVIGEVEDMLSMPLNLSIDELVNHIHDFNGIAVAAHIDRGFSIISQLGYMPPQLKLDAVEIRNLDKIDSIKTEFLQNCNLNIISSSDSHYLDMMIKPKMKLWLKEANVSNCLNCIKGEGLGRITIRQKTKSRRAGDSTLSAKKITSTKDWKGIYK